MNTDNLTERISIRYFNTERNSKGDIVKTEEVTRCTIWANVKPLNGKIQEVEPMRENTLKYQITVRYRQDIKPDDEILWRGRKLKITVPPYDIDSKHAYAQFNAEEVVQDGQNG